MSFAELLETYVDMRERGIQVGMVCKIESFNASTMRADILPLVKEQNILDEVSDYPVIPDVPVQFVQIGAGCYIKPFYQQGDLVWVGFSTFDIRKSLNAQKETVTLESKTFGLENACVLARIAEQSWTEPQNLIKFENGKLTLKVGSTEVSIGSSGVEVTGDFKASGNVEGGHVIENGLSIGQIKSGFNAHVHPFVATTPPTGITGTPL
ncbi:hypothetical protein LEP1GSC058_3101 [Leptospira fainei serovar Hurstbridge str. BUT 6]|uniref:Phage protein Gp138 N-terminal domain-containing protein n=1 Tax=Leptospira fainei serovar Hurstbridge str. BUT 6 TaxID=1193011 RepID=S3UUT1_9LEPT|nr:Gp138 family membrane-puncturing spike protein [Leptospira fainei]EPG72993.1 hypothetical protein LEP1GSC058_3101 [Leptospira fainei serovar Hurstbridge str. BUT 6]